MCPPSHNVAVTDLRVLISVAATGRNNNNALIISHRGRAGAILHFAGIPAELKPTESERERERESIADDERPRA